MHIMLIHIVRAFSVNLEIQNIQGIGIALKVFKYFSLVQNINCSTISIKYECDNVFIYLQRLSDVVSCSNK